jgi:hypothetical protein
MASARFVRESIRVCGTLCPRAQDGDGRGVQLHVYPGNDTVILIVTDTGAEELWCARLMAGQTYH